MALDLYRNLVSLADDANFRRRVKGAMVAQALTVTAEATNTPFHVKRRLFANQVLLSPDSALYAMALAVAQDATVGEASNVQTGTDGNPDLRNTVTDAQLKAAVSAVWNAFAVADDTP